MGNLFDEMVITAVVKDTDFTVEVVFEGIKVKQDVIVYLEGNYHEPAVLCSSASGLSSNEIEAL